jgi:hypothetical protein
MEAETKYGWGTISPKYYHKLTYHVQYQKSPRWMDCNSWQRVPRPEPPFPSSGILPCPKCFRKEGKSQ